MADYGKTTNFTAKDSLITGDPEKVIKGEDVDTEFDNIETAIVTKADITGDTFTGDVIVTGTLTATNASANEIIKQQVFS